MPNDNAAPTQEPALTPPGDDVEKLPIMVKDLSRLQLEKGDTLIVKIKTKLSEPQRTRIIHYLKRELPGVRYLLIDESIDLAVMRAPQKR